MEEDPVGLKWLEIYFNATFLAQTLKALIGETVTLQCNGSLSPVVARTEEDGLMALLMPVNRS
jgi:DNA polymerase III sliding clamp (beta) subunit (PCNA family)